MAQVTLSIGGYGYTVACRDGEEQHLLDLGAALDAKVVEARGTVGQVSEVRQLLFAALLLADELGEARVGTSAPAPAGDTASAAAIEQLAARLEAMADRLENGVTNA